MATLLRTARKMAQGSGILALLTACGASSTSPGGAPGPNGDAPITYSTDVKNGIATFYDATGSGNCSFDDSPHDLDVTALGFAEYAGSAMCGACLRVRGPKGEVTVRMVDSCPGCEVGHLDLSKEAFAKIAEPREGRVSITYQTISCAVQGPISYRFKDGSSKWWTAIQVLNHRIPITKLEFQKSGQYVPMRRESYNYFVVDDGVGDLPDGLHLRVTSADGQVLEDVLPGTIEGNKTVTGSGQFE